MRNWLDTFEDSELPILSSLVGALRGGTAPSIDDEWEPEDGSAGVAPRPVPLESLQSLPVAGRLLV
jgi:hypothetical protein